MFLSSSTFKKSFLRCSMRIVGDTHSVKKKSFFVQTAKSSLSIFQKKTGADLIRAIEVDAPLTLFFSLACLIVHVMALTIGDHITIQYFSVHPWRFFQYTSPTCYWRIVGQVLGHGDWGHMSGNIVNLLLVSPACEREYGAYNLLKIIVYLITFLLRCLA